MALKLDGVPLTGEPDPVPRIQAGHIQVSVDGDPPTPGERMRGDAVLLSATETAVSIEGVTPGEHTVWTVLADFDRVAVSPPAIASARFFVGFPPVPWDNEDS